MKPYFETELGKLYCGDCLDVMKDMQDRSVDLVLTDPPYNIGKDYGVYKDNNKDYNRWIIEVFEETRRIANATILTPGIANMFIYPKPDWVLCWGRVTYWVGAIIIVAGTIMMK